MAQRKWGLSPFLTATDQRLSNVSAKRIMGNVPIIRRKSTVGGRPPETLSLGIKRTGGSHPMERVSGGLPRALPPIRNSRCPPTESSARHSALSAAYLRWDGSLRSALFPAKVCRRQGLDRSRPIGFGEPIRHSPYRARKIMSELFHLIHGD